MKYILIILLFTFTLSSQQFSTEIYHTYTVEHSDFDEHYWLIVNNKDGAELDENSFRWEYKEKNLNPKTLAMELAPAIQNDGQVLLTMPSFGFFNELAQLPYPQVRFPLELGDSIYVEQKIAKNISKDSMIVRGYLKVVKLDRLDIKGRVPKDIIKRWTLEAHSFDNPNYTATYVYSNALGFEKMIYELDGKIIQLTHQSIFSLEM